MKPQKIKYAPLFAALMRRSAAACQSHAQQHSGEQWRIFYLLGLHLHPSGFDFWRGRRYNKESCILSFMPPLRLEYS